MRRNEMGKLDKGVNAGWTRRKSIPNDGAATGG